MKQNLTAPDGGEELELSTKIIQEVAQSKGVNPTDLTPLWGKVNVDALNDLCNQSQKDVKVVFEYEGYTVTIHSDNYVQLES